MQARSSQNCHGGAQRGHFLQTKKPMMFSLTADHTPHVLYDDV